MVQDFGNRSADIYLVMQAAGQAGHSIAKASMIKAFKKQCSMKWILAVFSPQTYLNVPNDTKSANKPKFIE